MAEATLTPNGTIDNNWELSGGATAHECIGTKSDGKNINCGGPNAKTAEIEMSDGPAGTISQIVLTGTVQHFSACGGTLTQCDCDLSVDGGSNWLGVKTFTAGYDAYADSSQTWAGLSHSGLSDIRIKPHSTGCDAVDYIKAVVTYATTAPEINITGNGQNIADGDTTPATADDTDFGGVKIGGIHDHIFTIQNTGDANLTLTNSPAVVIGGAQSAEFAVQTDASSPIAPTGSTTFTIRAAPTATGQRNAILSIANNDADEDPYTFYICIWGLPPAGGHFRRIKCRTFQDTIII